MLLVEPPAAQVSVRVKSFKAEHYVPLIADTMRQVTGVFGSCDRDDLISAGFPAGAVDQHYEAAAAQATRDWVRQIEGAS